MLFINKIRKNQLVSLLFNYIYSHPQTDVSLYHNTSEWLDTQINSN